MNAGLMIEYVKFVADHLLATLKMSKLYNTACPLDFMNLISLTNFFERRA